MTEAKEATIAIETDRKIRTINQMKDYKKKTCLLIDMALLTDSNILIKQYDKIIKYKNLGKGN